MAIHTDFTHLAEMGIASGKVWAANYPNLIVDFTTPADYLSFHEGFRNDILARKQNEVEKREAIIRLKEVNKKINAHLKNLKDALYEQYGKDKIADYGPIYGLVIRNDTYSFPADNEVRASSLEVLVKELSKPGNIVAKQRYGRNFWTELRDEHHQVWTLCKAIDEKEVLYADKIQQLRTQANEMQSRLRMNLRLIFGEQYDAIGKEFGFKI